MNRRGMECVAVGVVTLIVGLLWFQDLSYGSNHSRAKALLQQTCVPCHRLEGTADSRFNLRAPDLMWAGSKYQRSWLIRWLTGKEAPLYTKGYRWDLTEVAARHPMVTESEANDIAEYFAEHNKDPRVRVGAFDLSKVTKFDVAFGGAAIALSGEAMTLSAVFFVEHLASLNARVGEVRTQPRLVVLEVLDTLRGEIPDHRT